MIKTALCPWCGAEDKMTAVEWGRHVDACARIEEGLRRLKASTVFDQDRVTMEGQR